MNVRLIAASTVIVASAAAALGFAASSNNNPTPTAPAPLVAPQADQKFSVDAVHSSVMFRLEHMGVCNFYGAFREVSGSYTLGDNAAFEISVKTDSVDSRNKGRDDHLKSPDFFNAAEFPAITFKSTKVEKDGEGLKVTGDLTLHGVTKSVTVDMKTWAPKETRQGVKSGIETSFTIKRSDYGMTTYVAEGGLGDEVDIVVALEGAAAKE
jgi:polyisoprenoid-binding protein YceI